MKWTFLVLLISSIGFSACNNEAKKDSETVKEGADDNDSTDDSYANVNTISEGDARKMINHWLSLPKTPEHIIQQITLDGERLDSFLKKSDLFKMYMAAYPAPMNGHMKDEPMIIISRVRKGKRVYYDINDLFPPVVSAKSSKPPPLCPPPTGCDFPLSTESLDSATHLTDSVNKK